MFPNAWFKRLISGCLEYVAGHALTWLLLLLIEGNSKTCFDCLVPNGAPKLIGLSKL